MRISDFDFDLPENRIALRPARPRDSARLLCVGEALEDRVVRDLPGLLRPGDILVLNDTKVIPAQLTGLRPPRGAGAVEPQAVHIDVTLHKRLSLASRFEETPSSFVTPCPLHPEEARSAVTKDALRQAQDEGDRALRMKAFLLPGTDAAGARWKAFVRPAKRVRAGDRIDFTPDFFAEVEARDGAEAVLRFNVGGAEFDAALARAGAPPLPPYIARKRALTPDDARDYQTVYADEPGSVAAPTAGLHFTETLFAALEARGVSRVTVTLHVGAGTFLPVTVEDTRDHVMHAEWGEITGTQAAAINAARANGGRVVAVGTTALRLLESAADETGKVCRFADETAIFITPGYKFRAVDLLMTNFHLPRSTLFMLASAFAGTARMKAAYKHAIEAGYRFYSYGDACLLEPARSE